jgi:selenide,water dikinase
MPGVHALTDVTGFGLLGHLLEMCRGSSLGARIERSRLPVLPGVTDLAQSGFITGASGRNWSSYGTSVQLPAGLPDWERALLCDPQTSGGLLIAVTPEHVDALLRRLNTAGFSRSADIGEITTGEPIVRVA